VRKGMEARGGASGFRGEELPASQRWHTQASCIQDMSRHALKYAAAATAATGVLKTCGGMLLNTRAY
jgi:hypothetical protein